MPMKYGQWAIEVFKWKRAIEVYKGEKGKRSNVSDNQFLEKFLLIFKILKRCFKI